MLGQSDIKWKLLIGFLQNMPKGLNEEGIISKYFINTWVFHSMSSFHHAQHTLIRKLLGTCLHSPGLSEIPTLKPRLKDQMRSIVDIAWRLNNWLVSLRLFRIVDYADSSPFLSVLGYLILECSSTRNCNRKKHYSEWQLFWVNFVWDYFETIL